MIFFNRYYLGSVVLVFSHSPFSCRHALGSAKNNLAFYESDDFTHICSILNLAKSILRFVDLTIKQIGYHPIRACEARLMTWRIGHRHNTSIGRIDSRTLSGAERQLDTTRAQFTSAPEWLICLAASG